MQFFYEILFLSFIVIHTEIKTNLNLLNYENDYHMGPVY